MSNEVDEAAFQDIWRRSLYADGTSDVLESDAEVWFAAGVTTERARCVAAVEEARRLYGGRIRWEPIFAAIRGDEGE